MTRATTQVEATPPRGLDQLDPLLQHRSRLGAMVLLSSADLTFSRLKTSHSARSPLFLAWARSYFLPSLPWKWKTLPVSSPLT